VAYLLSHDTLSWAALRFRKASRSSDAANDVDSITDAERALRPARISQGTSNVAIQGLTFQNYPAIGVVFYGGVSGFGGILPRTNATLNPSGIVISNNFFLNGNGGGPPFYANNDGQNSPTGNGIFSTEAPAVWFCGTASHRHGGQMFGGIIEHNAIINHMSTPIVVQADNVIVRNNYIQNVNVAGFDTGAIYCQYNRARRFCTITFGMPKASQRHTARMIATSALSIWTTMLAIS